MSEDNSLKLKILKGRSIYRNNEAKAVNAYVKVVVQDGSEQMKRKTPVVKESHNPNWMVELNFPNIASIKPEVTLTVARYTKLGKSKPLGKCSIETKALDPGGVASLLELALDGCRGILLVKATWTSPRLVRLREEEKKRREEEKKQMLARAWEDLRKLFATFPSKMSFDHEEDKDRNSLHAARQILTKIDSFLRSLEMRLEKNYDFLKPKVQPLLSGPVKKLLVHGFMQSFEAFNSMQQKDFKLVLRTLARFQSLWTHYGGSVPKELTAMPLPIIKHFCVNCEASLRKVIERVFRQVTTEAPVRRKDGKFTTNGPRDLFTVLRGHVGGLLPHISGVAVEELAQFELQLLSYFQSLFRNKLRCIHFNKTQTSMVKASLFSRRRLSSAMVSLPPFEESKKDMNTSTIDSPSSPTSPDIGLGERRESVESFELNEDYIISIISSCQDYQECSDKLFREMKIQMLRGTELKGKKELAKDFALTLTEMAASVSSGFDAIARVACGVLADYWARQIEEDCFSPLFGKAWVNSSHLGEKVGSEEKHPCMKMYTWWKEAVEDVHAAIPWEKGIGFLMSALIYASMDAYVRKFAQSSLRLTQNTASKFMKSLARSFKGKSEEGESSSRIINALFDDVNWIRNRISQSSRELGICDKKEALEAIAIVQTAAEFLAVEEKSQLEVDAYFGTIFERLGVFAGIVVKGLIRVHSDWSKGTKAEVLERFSQYEQALGDFGGKPLIPDVGDSQQSSEILEKIRDMARLCDCLRGLDVIYTASGPISARPAIMVAKKNKSTPWYGITLLFYTEAKTKRVSALKIGRALQISGIEARLKEEMEKITVVLGCGEDDGKAGSDEQRNRSGIKAADALDVVTLEDFLS